MSSYQFNHFTYYIICCPKKRLNQSIIVSNHSQYLSMMMLIMLFSRLAQIEVCSGLGGRPIAKDACFWVCLAIVWADDFRRAIIIYMKALQSNANLAEIQSRLNKYSFLSKNTLPGAPDGRVFAILENTRRYPDRKANPNFYHWYILMKQFSPSTISKWVSGRLYDQPDDPIINEFSKLHSPKKDLSAQGSQALGSESRNNKNENSSQIQYSIDVAVKDYDVGRMSQLRRLLDHYKAQMSEQEVNGTIHICIVCRVDPANLEELSGKVSRCIEFNELSLRKKDRKAQKVALLVSEQQKVQ